MRNKADSEQRDNTRRLNSQGIVGQTGACLQEASVIMWLS